MKLPYLIYLPTFLMKHTVNIHSFIFTRVSDNFNYKFGFLKFTIYSTAKRYFGCLPRFKSVVKH